MDGNILATLLHSLGPGIDPTMIPEGVAPQPAPQAPQASSSPLNDARRILGLPMPQQNVMQAAAAPPDMPQPAPVPSAPAPAAPAAPARTRRSLLDTVGRISDVLARVGGADALYQPTIDSREDRAHLIDTQGLQRQLTTQEIGKGADEATTRHNALVGNAVRGLQSIRRANPNADIGTVWPLLARQAGIPDDQAARLSQIFATHPEAIDGMSALINGHQEYNGQVVYARDANGHIAAFQPSNSNASEARNILPAGFEPIDPLTFVNTGNAQVGVHSRSGTVERILPIAERPGEAANRAQRGEIADASNRTAITIAGMPARASGTAAHAATDPTNGLTLLNSIEHAFGELHRMNALPGDDGGTVGNIVSALGRTGVGQAIGEQAGSPAAQMRLEIGKNVSALQQEMLRSLPASATRTRFEQEMLARGLPDPTRMSLATARTVIGQLRESYTRALAASRRQAAPAARGGASAPAARIVPRGGGNLPTLTPAQAAAAAPGTRFRSTDGRVMVRH